MTSADRDCSEENKVVQEKVPAKRNWQLTFIEHFHQIKDKVAVEVRWGTALFVLWSFFCFGIGWFVCHHGEIDDINYTSNYIHRHNPTLIMESLGVPFCLDKGQYFQVTRSSTWSFKINDKQNVSSLPHKELMSFPRPKED
jgi:hypothetical protein